jgi:hypothetical protein
MFITNAEIASSPFDSLPSGLSFLTIVGYRKVYENHS